MYPFLHYVLFANDTTIVSTHDNLDILLDKTKEILKKLLGDNFDPSAPVTMPQIEQPVGLETEDGPVGVIASLMPLSEIEAHIPEPPVEEPVREPTPDDPKNYQMFEQNPTDSTLCPLNQEK